MAGICSNAEGIIRYINILSFNFLINIPYNSHILISTYIVLILDY